MVLRSLIYLKISGLGATLNVAKPKKGSSVAVFGLGAVGLAVSFRNIYIWVKYIVSLDKSLLFYPNKMTLTFEFSSVGC